MAAHTKTTRRGIMKAGLASLAATAASIPEAFTAPKAPGETKVIYFGGDYIHNGVGQERYLRQTFSKSGWRMLFAQASRFITPEVLADTDLFMLNRIGDTDAQGFSTLGLVEERPEPDPFLTPEMENAIIDNVRNRGMGFIALHCTAGNSTKLGLMTLLGIKPARGGAPLQPVRCHDFDQRHQITRGFGDFVIDPDENLIKEIVDGNVTRLFTSTGENDGSTCPGGWCAERGKGRMVVLMAGHTNEAWSHSKYREIHWRAAHWAMKRDIPPFGMKS